MDKCPCEICITRAICQNKLIWDMLAYCPNVRDFLVAQDADHYDPNVLLYEDNFFLFCEILNIGARKGTFHEQEMDLSYCEDNLLKAKMI